MNENRLVDYLEHMRQNFVWDTVQFALPTSLQQLSSIKDN
jgi:uncharacterized protein with HEPN domain